MLGTINKVMKRMLSVVMMVALVFTMSVGFAGGKAYALTPSTYEGNGIKVECDRDLSKGIEAGLPTGNNSTLKIHLDISVSDGESELSALTLQSDNYEQHNHWILSGTNDTVDLIIQKCGEHKIIVEKANGSKYEIPFLVWPRAPQKDMTIVTIANKIYFDTYMMNKSEYGDYLYVGIDDSYYLIDLGMKWNYNKYIKLSANKTYNLKLCGVIIKDGKNYKSQTPTSVKVKTGPITKPVIKSVKISKVKVSKGYNYHFNSSGQWVPYYKTSWTTKVTLSKRAKGIKGIILNDGYNDYKIKGNKKTYTKKMSIVSEGFNHKGWKHKFTVTTYSDNNCMAYSPTSNVKSAKIK